MPLNTTTKKFTRAFAFVDEFAIGDEVTREALDQALDDLAGGINGIVALGYQEVGEWSAASGAFPTTRPDLTAIQAKDAWRVTAAGTVGGQAFVVGDFLVALRAGGGLTYPSNWLRVTGNVAAFQQFTQRAELAATQAEANKSLAATSAQEAEDYAQEAKDAAEVLTSFAERADIGPYVSDGSTLDYDLPFDPVNIKFVELHIGNFRAWAPDDFSGIVKDDSPSGFGLRLVSPVPDGTVIRGSLVRPAQPLQPSDTEATLDLADLGVIGDGITEDAPSFLAALEAAAGRKVIGRSDATYRISTSVDFTGPHNFDISMSKVIVPANVTPFILRNVLSGPFALTADYVLGSKNLAVSMATALTPGTKIKIVSDARDPANRDNGASSSQYRVGEWAVVGEGSTTSNIVLMSPLANVEGVAETGGYVRVASYTTARSARVIVPAQGVVAKASLGELRFDEGHDGGDWTAPAIVYRGHINPEIRTPAIMRGYQIGLDLRGTYGAQVHGVRGQRLENDTANGHYGYLVAEAGCFGTTVWGVQGEDCRHVYTTSSIATTADQSNLYTLMATGSSDGSRVFGLVGRGGDNAHGDTHHCAKNVIFESPLSDGANGSAFAARGSNITYRNPQVRNCGGQGVLAFTEFAGGDSPYTNGRAPQDMTSARIIDPDIETRREGIEANKAFCTVEGHARIRAVGPSLIHCDGAVMDMHASMDAILTGVPEGGDGWVYRVDVHSSLLAAAIPKSVLTINAPAIVDARAWGATARGFYVETGAELIIRSVIKLIMPAGSTFMTGGGTLRCEGAGEIQWSQVGSPGLPAGLTGLPVRVLAGDGTVYDGLTRSFHVGADERLRMTSNGASLYTNGGGIRLEDTDTGLSDAEDASAIIFGTNDDSNPAMDAAAIRARGNGSTGFVDMFFQRKNTAGALIDAMRLHSTGSMTVFKADGVTLGFQWIAGTEQFVIGGTGGIRMGSSAGPLILSGTGTPEAVVTAPVGSLFLRSDGGAGTSLYVKQTGTGNTGWVGK